MKKHIIILFSVVCMGLLWCAFTRAAALSVSPYELKIKTGKDFLARKEIVVKNPGGDVSLFRVFPDDFSDFIKVKPESFILEGGQSRRVALTVKNSEIGIFSTRLSVVASPLGEQKFKASSGVKIPLEIEIKQGSQAKLFLASLAGLLERRISVKSFLFILAVISLGFTFLLPLIGSLRRKKQQLR